MVVACFLLQQIAYAAPSQSVGSSGQVQGTEPKVSLDDVLTEPHRLKIPRNQAQVRSAYSGTNGKFITLIQDAHTNYSAQLNVAGILQKLFEDYPKLSLVMTEGGSGDSTLSSLRDIETPKHWNIHAKKLLMDGMIDGIEFFNLTSEHLIKIIGVENSELYDQNLNSFIDIKSIRDEIEAYLHRINVSITRIKEKQYPKTLIDYESLLKESVFKKFQSLFKIAIEHKIDLNKFNQIQKYELLQKMEKEINFNQVEKEKETLIRALSHIVRGEDKLLLNKSSSSSTHLDLLQYLDDVMSLARENGIPLHSFRQLVKYSLYLRALGSIDMEVLFEEMRMLENSIYKTLLETDELMTVHYIDRYCQYLKKAYQIHLSNSEYQSLKSMHDALPTVSWQAFINKHLENQDDYEDLIPFKEILDSTYEKLLRFYELVQKRDLAFIENIHDHMADEDIGVLVVGGYHTQHMTQLLRSKGYSYIVVSPLIKHETNTKQYERILLASAKEQSNYTLDVQVAASRLDSLTAIANTLKSPKREKAMDIIQVMAGGISPSQQNPGSRLTNKSSDEDYERKQWEQVQNLIDKEEYSRLRDVVDQNLIRGPFGFEGAYRLIAIDEITYGVIQLYRKKTDNKARTKLAAWLAKLVYPAAHPKAMVRVLPFYNYVVEVNHAISTGQTSYWVAIRDFFYRDLMLLFKATSIVIKYRIWDQASNGVDWIHNHELPNMRMLRVSLDDVYEFRLMIAHEIAHVLGIRAGNNAYSRIRHEENRDIDKRLKQESVDSVVYRYLQRSLMRLAVLGVLWVGPAVIIGLVSIAFTPIQVWLMYGSLIYFGLSSVGSILATKREARLQNDKDFFGLYSRALSQPDYVHGDLGLLNDEPADSYDEGNKLGIFIYNLLNESGHTFSQMIEVLFLNLLHELPGDVLSRLKITGSASPLFIFDAITEMVEWYEENDEALFTTTRPELVKPAKELADQDGSDGSRMTQIPVHDFVDYLSDDDREGVLSDLDSFGPWSDERANELRQLLKKEGSEKLDQILDMDTEFVFWDFEDNSGPTITLMKHIRSSPGLWHQAFRSVHRKYPDDSSRNEYLEMYKIKGSPIERRQVLIQQAVEMHSPNEDWIANFIITRQEEVIDRLVELAGDLELSEWSDVVDRTRTVLIDFDIEVYKIVQWDLRNRYPDKDGFVLLHGSMDYKTNKGPQNIQRGMNLTWSLREAVHGYAYLDGSELWVVKVPFERVNWASWMDMGGEVAIGLLPGPIEIVDVRPARIKDNQDLEKLDAREHIPEVENWTYSEGDMPSWVENQMTYKEIANYWTKLILEVINYLQEEAGSLRDIQWKTILRLNPIYVTWGLIFHLFIRKDQVVVKGIENIPLGKDLLIASNHASAVGTDGNYVATEFGLRIGKVPSFIILKRQLGALMTLLARVGGSIAVERHGVVDKMVKIFSSKLRWWRRYLMIFPAGIPTHSLRANVSSARARRSRFLEVAAKTQTDVLPVFIHTTVDHKKSMRQILGESIMYRIGRAENPPGMTHVYIGDPIKVNEDSDLAEKHDEWANAILELEREFKEENASRLSNTEDVLYGIRDNGTERNIGWFDPEEWTSELQAALNRLSQIRFEDQVILDGFDESGSSEGLEIVGSRLANENDVYKYLQLNMKGFRFKSLQDFHESDAGTGRTWIEQMSHARKLSYEEDDVSMESYPFLVLLSALVFLNDLRNKNIILPIDLIRGTQGTKSEPVDYLLSKFISTGSQELSKIHYDILTQALRLDHSVLMLLSDALDKTPISYGNREITNSTFADDFNNEFSQISSLLDDPEELQKFLFLLQITRSSYPEGKSTNHPKGLSDSSSLTPLEYAQKNGISFLYKNLQITPISQSFRRYILITNQEGAEYTLELKGPGEHDKRRFVGRKDYDIANVIQDDPFLTGKMLSPLALIEATGSFLIFGSWTNYSEERPLRVMIFKHRNGKRMNRLTQSYLSRVSRKLERSIEAVVNESIIQMLSIGLRFLQLGYVGRSWGITDQPVVTDSHPDNYIFLAEGDVAYSDDFNSYFNIQEELGRPLRISEVKQELRALYLLYLDSITHVFDNLELIDFDSAYETAALRIERVLSDVQASRLSQEIEPQYLFSMTIPRVKWVRSLIANFLGRKTRRLANTLGVNPKAFDRIVKEMVEPVDLHNISSSSDTEDLYQRRLSFHLKRDQFGIFPVFEGWTQRWKEQWLNEIELLPEGQLETTLLRARYRYLATMFDVENREFIPEDEHIESRLADYELSGLSPPIITREEIPLDGHYEQHSTIPAYLIIPNSKTHPRPKNGYPTIILNHGFADRKETPLLDYLEKMLIQKGFAVLRPDILGHGDNFHPFDDPDELIRAFNTSNGLFIKEFKNPSGSEQKMFNPDQIGASGFSFGGNLHLRYLTNEVIGGDLKGAALMSSPIHHSFKDAVFILRTRGDYMRHIYDTRRFRKVVRYLEELSLDIAHLEKMFDVELSETSRKLILRKHNWLDVILGIIKDLIDVVNREDRAVLPLEVTVGVDGEDVSGNNVSDRLMFAFGDRDPVVKHDDIDLIYRLMRGNRRHVLVYKGEGHVFSKEALHDAQRRFVDFLYQKVVLDQDEKSGSRLAIGMSVIDESGSYSHSQIHLLLSRVLGIKEMAFSSDAMVPDDKGLPVLSDEAYRLLTEAYRLELDLLREMELLPVGDEGIVINLMSGINLFPFEHSRGISVDYRGVEAGWYQEYLAKLMNRLSVDYKGDLIEKNQVHHSVDFLRTRDLIDLVNGIHDGGDIVFMSRNPELWVKYGLYHQGFHNIKQAGEEYSRAFERFVVQVLEGRPFILFGLEIQNQQTIQILKEHGYIDVFPELIGENSRNTLKELDRFSNADGVATIQTVGAERNLDLDLGGKMWVFQKGNSSNQGVHASRLAGNVKRSSRHPNEDDDKPFAYRTAEALSRLLTPDELNIFINGFNVRAAKYGWRVNSSIEPSEEDLARVSKKIADAMRLQKTDSEFAIIPRELSLIMGEAVNKKIHGFIGVNHKGKEELLFDATYLLWEKSALLWAKEYKTIRISDVVIENIGHEVSKPLVRVPGSREIIYVNPKDEVGVSIEYEWSDYSNEFIPTRIISNQGEKIHRKAHVLYGWKDGGYQLIQSTWKTRAVDRLVEDYREEFARIKIENVIDSSSYGIVKPHADFKTIDYKGINSKNMIGVTDIGFELLLSSDKTLYKPFCLYGEGEENIHHAWFTLIVDKDDMNKFLESESDDSMPPIKDAAYRGSHRWHWIHAESDIQEGDYIYSPLYVTNRKRLFVDMEDSKFYQIPKIEPNEPSYGLYQMRSGVHLLVGFFVGSRYYELKELHVSHVSIFDDDDDERLIQLFEWAKKKYGANPDRLDAAIEAIVKGVADGVSSETIKYRRVKKAVLLDYYRSRRSLGGEARDGDGSPTRPMRISDRRDQALDSIMFENERGAHDEVMDALGHTLSEQEILVLVDEFGLDPQSYGWNISPSDGSEPPPSLESVMEKIRTRKNGPRLNGALEHLHWLRSQGSRLSKEERIQEIIQMIPDEIRVLDERNLSLEQQVDKRKIGVNLWNLFQQKWRTALSLMGDDLLDERNQDILILSQSTPLYQTNKIIPLHKLAHLMSIKVWTKNKLGSVDIRGVHRFMRDFDLNFQKMILRHFVVNHKGEMLDETDIYLLWLAYNIKSRINDTSALRVNEAGVFLQELKKQIGYRYVAYKGYVEELYRVANVAYTEKEGAEYEDFMSDEFLVNLLSTKTVLKRLEQTMLSGMFTESESYEMYKDIDLHSLTPHNFKNSTLELSKVDYQATELTLWIRTIDPTKPSTVDDLARRANYDPNESPLGVKSIPLGTITYVDDEHQGGELMRVIEIQSWLRLGHNWVLSVKDIDRLLKQITELYARQERYKHLFVPTGSQLFGQGLYIAPDTVQRVNDSFANSDYELLYYHAKWWWHLSVKKLSQTMDSVGGARLAELNKTQATLWAIAVTAITITLLLNLAPALGWGIFQTLTLSAFMGHVAGSFLDGDQNAKRFIFAILFIIPFAYFVSIYVPLVMAIPNFPGTEYWLKPVVDLLFWSQIHIHIGFTWMGLKDVPWSVWKKQREESRFEYFKRIKGVITEVYKDKLHQIYSRKGFFDLQILFWSTITSFNYYAAGPSLTFIGQVISVSASIFMVSNAIHATKTFETEGRIKSRLEKILGRIYMVSTGVVLGINFIFGLVWLYGFVIGTSFALPYVPALGILLATLGSYGVVEGFHRIREAILDRFKSFSRFFSYTNAKGEEIRVKLIVEEMASEKDASDHKSYRISVYTSDNHYGATFRKVNQFHYQDVERLHTSSYRLYEHLSQNFSDSYLDESAAALHGSRLSSPKGVILRRINRLVDWLWSRQNSKKYLALKQYMLDFRRVPGFENTIRSLLIADSEFYDDVWGHRGTRAEILGLSWLKDNVIGGTILGASVPFARLTRGSQEIDGLMMVNHDKALLPRGLTVLEFKHARTSEGVRETIEETISSQMLEQFELIRDFLGVNFSFNYLIVVASDEEFDGQGEINEEMHSSNVRVFSTSIKIDLTAENNAGNTITNVNTPTRSIVDKWSTSPKITERLQRIFMRIQEALIRDASHKNDAVSRAADANLRSMFGSNFYKQNSDKIKRLYQPNASKRKSKKGVNYWKVQLRKSKEHYKQGRYELAIVEAEKAQRLLMNKTKLSPLESAKKISEITQFIERVKNESNSGQDSKSASRLAGEPMRVVKMITITNPNELEMIPKKYGKGSGGTTSYASAETGLEDIPLIDVVFDMNLAYELPFDRRFNGAEVGFVGPGRQGDEIISFIKRYREVKSIHIFDRDPLNFREIDKLLLSLKSAGGKMPDVYGHLVDIHELPQRMMGQLDFVFEAGVVDKNSFDDGQREQVFNQIDGLLKKGAVLFSSPIDFYPWIQTQSHHHTPKRYQLLPDEALPYYMLFTPFIYQKGYVGNASRMANIEYEDVVRLKDHFVRVAYWEVGDEDVPTGETLFITDVYPAQEYGGEYIKFQARSTMGADLFYTFILRKDGEVVQLSDLDDNLTHIKGLVDMQELTNRHRWPGQPKEAVDQALDASFTGADEDTEYIQQAKLVLRQFLLGNETLRRTVIRLVGLLYENGMDKFGEQGKRKEESLDEYWQRAAIEHSVRQLILAYITARYRLSYLPRIEVGRYVGESNGNGKFPEARGSLISSMEMVLDTVEKSTNGAPQDDMVAMTQHIKRLAKVRHRHVDHQFLDELSTNIIEEAFVLQWAMNLNGANGSSGSRMSQREIKGKNTIGIGVGNEFFPEAIRELSHSFSNAPVQDLSNKSKPTVMRAHDNETLLNEVKGEMFGWLEKNGMTSWKTQSPNFGEVSIHVKGVFHPSRIKLEIYLEEPDYNQNSKIAGLGENGGPKNPNDGRPGALGWIYLEPHQDLDGNLFMVIKEIQPTSGFYKIRGSQVRKHFDPWRLYALEVLQAWALENNILLFSTFPEMILEGWPTMENDVLRKNYFEPLEAWGNGPVVINSSAWTSRELYKGAFSTDGLPLPWRSAPSNIKVLLNRQNAFAASRLATRSLADVITPALAKELLKPDSVLSPKERDLLAYYQDQLDQIPAYSKIGEVLQVSPQRARGLFLSVRGKATHVRDIHNWKTSPQPDLSVGLSFLGISEASRTTLFYLEIKTIEDLLNSYPFELLNGDINNEEFQAIQKAINDDGRLPQDTALFMGSDDMKKLPVEDLINMPILAIGQFSTRTANIIRRLSVGHNSIRNVGDLLTSGAEKKILRNKLVGPIAIKEINQVLDGYGLRVGSRLSGKEVKKDNLMEWWKEPDDEFVQLLNSQKPSLNLREVTVDQANQIQFMDQAKPDPIQSLSSPIQWFAGLDPIFEDEFSVKGSGALPDGWRRKVLKIGNVYLLDHHYFEHEKDGIREVVRGLANSPDILFIDFEQSLLTDAHINSTLFSIATIAELGREDLSDEVIWDAGSADSPAALLALKKGAKVILTDDSQDYLDLFRGYLGLNDLEGAFDDGRVKLIQGDLNDTEQRMAEMVIARPTLMISNLGPFYKETELKALSVAKRLSSLKTIILSGHQKNWQGEMGLSDKSTSHFFNEILSSRTGNSKLDAVINYLSGKGVSQWKPISASSVVQHDFMRGEILYGRIDILSIRFSKVAQREGLNSRTSKRGLGAARLAFMDLGQDQQHADVNRMSSRDLRGNPEAGLKVTWENPQIEKKNKLSLALEDDSQLENLLYPFLLVLKGYKIPFLHARVVANSDKVISVRVLNHLEERLFTLTLTAHHSDSTIVHISQTAPRLSFVSDDLKQQMNGGFLTRTLPKWLDERGFTRLTLEPLNKTREWLRNIGFRSNLNEAEGYFYLPIQFTSDGKDSGGTIMTIRSEFESLQVLPMLPPTTKPTPSINAARLAKIMRHGTRGNSMYAVEVGKFSAVLQLEQDGKYSLRGKNGLLLDGGVLSQIKPSRLSKQEQGIDVEFKQFQLKIKNSLKQLDRRIYQISSSNRQTLLIALDTSFAESSHKGLLSRLASRLSRLGFDAITGEEESLAFEIQSKKEKGRKILLITSKGSRLAKTDGVTKLVLNQLPNFQEMIDLPSAIELGLEMIYQPGEYDEVNAPFRRLTGTRLSIASYKTFQVTGLLRATPQIRPINSSIIGWFQKRLRTTLTSA